MRTQKHLGNLVKWDNCNSCSDTSVLHPSAQVSKECSLVFRPTNKNQQLCLTTISPQMTLQFICTLSWLHFLCMPHIPNFEHDIKEMQNTLSLLGLVFTCSRQASLAISRETFRGRGAGLAVGRELSQIAACRKHERGRTLLVSLTARI